MNDPLYTNIFDNTLVPFLNNNFPNHYHILQDKNHSRSLTCRKVTGGINGSRSITWLNPRETLAQLMKHEVKPKNLWMESLPLNTVDKPQCIEYHTSTLWKVVPQVTWRLTYWCQAVCFSNFNLGWAAQYSQFKQWGGNSSSTGSEWGKEATVLLSVLACYSMWILLVQYVNLILIDHNCTTPNDLISTKGELGSHPESSEGATKTWKMRCDFLQG